MHYAFMQCQSCARNAAEPGKVLCNDCGMTAGKATNAFNWSAAVSSEVYEL